LYASIFILKYFIALIFSVGFGYLLLLCRLELYKVIGELDVIASPFQGGRKLMNGVRDVFYLPFEGYFTIFIDVFVVIV